MGEWIGSMVAFALFTALPAYLLASEYNLAVSVAFASLSATSISIFWNTSKLVKQGKSRQ